jgi:hypothetical protein
MNPDSLCFNRRMYLIQILLPLRKAGRKVPPRQFREVAHELSREFGGMTAYTRSPAEGRWRKHGAGTIYDDVIVYEVMTTTLRARWWARYRRRLEQQFLQQEIVIRAQRMRRL